ncbi:hypothetical protein Ac2012v2_002627 [Leucoagaricus gongylophorus]
MKSNLLSKTSGIATIRRKALTHLLLLIISHHIKPTEPRATGPRSDSHYTRLYNDPRAHIPDRYSATASQLYIPSQYIQFSSTNAFSHYQPREGGFSPSVKSQSYQVEYDQHSQQQIPYSDLRSSAHTDNGRSAVARHTQSVRSFGTPNHASAYTTPHHSTMHTSNGTPRQELQLNMTPGPSSSSNDFNQQSYSNSQFRYHSTT